MEKNRDHRRSVELQEDFIDRDNLSHKKRYTNLFSPTSGSPSNKSQHEFFKTLPVQGSPVSLEKDFRPIEEVYEVPASPSISTPRNIDDSEPYKSVIVKDNDRPDNSQILDTNLVSSRNIHENVSW